MRWFQYKPGVVGETQRVTHCEQPADDGGLRSWCRRTFDPELVEDTAEPGATPEDGQARPGAPCIPCLMLVTAATDRAEDATAPVATFGRPEIAQSAGLVRTPKTWE